MPARGAPVEVRLISIRRRADARGALTALLAERLGCSPSQVPLVEGEHGKLALDRAAGLADLRFNLSHSGERALMALAVGVELGVDLERVTPRRSPAYLADWTRREAYAKGLGSGLAGGVRHLELRPRGAGVWSVLVAGREEAPGWRVHDLDVGPGLVGALAAESEVDVSLRLDLPGVQRLEDGARDAEILDR